jgi:hypothetical protein
MARPAIVIALPVAERKIVADELGGAGFETITVRAPAELDALLESRHDVAVAILDGETDLDTSLEYYGLLHEGSRKIPALIVMSASALDRMFSPDSADEFFSRPYTADSLRWRVEAMCIRSMTVDDGSGPVIQGGSMEMGDWSRARPWSRSSIRRAASEDDHRDEPRLGGSSSIAQKVLLIDADTVTGHVTTSLGLDQVGRSPTAGAIRPMAARRDLTDIASPHPSGLTVVSLTSSPLNTDILEPRRVADASRCARPAYDFIVVDLHRRTAP